MRSDRFMASTDILLAVIALLVCHAAIYTCTEFTFNAMICWEALQGIETKHKAGISDFGKVMEAAPS